MPSLVGKRCDKLEMCILWFALNLQWIRRTKCYFKVRDTFASTQTIQIRHSKIIVSKSLTALNIENKLYYEDRFYNVPFHNFSIKDATRSVWSITIIIDEIKEKMLRETDTYVGLELSIYHQTFINLLKNVRYRKKIDLSLSHDFRPTNLVDLGKALNLY